MKGAIEYFVSQYLPICIGLLVGAMAHIGRMIASKEYPDLAHLVGYAMQLAMIGLVTKVFVDSIGINNQENHAFTAAIFALSAQEVVQWLKRVGWRTTLTNILGAFGIEAAFKEPEEDEDTKA